MTENGCKGKHLYVEKKQKGRILTIKPAKKNNFAGNKNQMNKYVLFLGLASVSILGACKGGWPSKDSEKALKSSEKNYCNVDGNFSIAFPSTPTVTKEVVPTEAGDIAMNMCMYEESKSKVYMVAYSDYPEGMISKSNAPEILEGSKNGALNSFGRCTVEDESKIEKDGNPGVYFKAKSTENYHVIYHLYIVGNRLYQVGLLNDKEYPSKSEINDYFSSFKFLKK